VVELDSIVAALSAARAEGSYAELPSASNAEFSIEDGYAVGRLLHARALRDGWTQVGMKLGFTNQAVWNAVGLDSPFWSPIYVETVTDRGRLSLQGLLEPRIEPEIVVGLGSPLTHGASRDEVVDAIEWASLGFEVVQCHFRNWEMTPADAIADGGLHGTLVTGERQRFCASEADALAEVEVELSRDDSVVAKGTGKHALGGPVDAVAWLMRLPGVEGIPAGFIITRGTLTTAFPGTAGETWHLASEGPLPLGELYLMLDA